MLIYLTRFQDNNECCPYLENSWKGYDFDTLEKLEQKELLLQPRKSKCVYLSEEGKKKARKLLDAYHLSDKDILEKFGFADRGIADSAWGGEEWHEMSCTLGF